MDFYQELDQIMRQDFGNRGLLSALPGNPVAEAAEALRQARRVLLLTGFPVQKADHSVIGETDGPSGTANLAAALLEGGADVLVVTDRFSYDLLKAALDYRAPGADLALLPEHDAAFVSACVRSFAPTHFICLEEPGKALDGHYHNMRGETVDEMVCDSSAFLSEAKQAGAVTIAVGDGGNEMGMGVYRREIEAHVPHGDAICAAGSADIALAGGVSNWWGWGIAALLSLQMGRSLLPTEAEEAELLSRVVAAGGVDGCTKEASLSVDRLPLPVHLQVLRQTARLLSRELARQELFHPELSRQEPSRQELSRQELSRQEPSRQELSRQGLRREALSNSRTAAGN